jgi:hypothetical protein
MSPKVCNQNYCFYLPEEIIRLVFSNNPLSKHQTLCLTALYSLDAQGLLADYREHLPGYMLQGWENCQGVLVELEGLGLLTLCEEELVLTHRPAAYRKGTSVVDLFAEMAGCSSEEFVEETEPQRLKSDPCRAKKCGWW